MEQTGNARCLIVMPPAVIRFAARSLSRTPAHSLTALIAIALGVGAATAVFSVVDRILFRGLPYRDSSRLVSVGLVAPVISSYDWLFWGTYQEWRELQKAQKPQSPFQAITSWIGVSDCDLAVAEPMRLNCARVEATFLNTLGMAPLIGRDFAAADDDPSAPPVAILAYDFWHSKFGGNPKVIGTSIRLDGISTQVIGVLPAGFELPTLAAVDLVLPQALRRGSERQRTVRAIGRLEPGTSEAAAAAAIRPLFDLFAGGAPADFRNSVKLRFRVESLHAQQIRESRLASILLLAAVVAVLLIVCANVANLQLARSLSRRREASIRAALGATRFDLIRHALAESLVLAVTGGVMGCAIALIMLRITMAIAPAGIIRLSEATLDLRVLTFSAAVSVLSAVLSGIAPAALFSQAGPLSTRSLASHGGKLRQGLVSMQIAASLTLLSTAGLLIHALASLQNDRLGLDVKDVLTASFTLSRGRYDTNGKQIAFFDELERRLADIPGVLVAAITDSLPPGGDPRSRPFIALKLAEETRQDGAPSQLVWRYVTPGYFGALRIPIIRGRGFTEEDRKSPDPAIILSQSLAARLFPGEDPSGRRIGSDVIVGVAADVKNSGLLSNPDPEHYYVRKHQPDATFRNQRPPYGWRRAVAMIRTSRDLSAAASWVRSVFREMDPALPVEIGTMPAHVNAFIARPRFNAAVLAFFALMATALAGLGIYGLVAFLVLERTQEIGVRMSVGATPRQVSMLMLAQALRWTIVGSVPGVIAAYWTARALQMMIHSAPNATLAVPVLTAFSLAALAAAAAWAPSRRAARVDPVIALRHD